MHSSTPAPQPDPTLAELAAQIGLDDLTPVEASQPMAEAGALSLNDDFEPEPKASPETFTTQPTFYNIGWSKAALVGGVGLVLFLGGASIFKVASPGGNTPATPAEAPSEETPEDPTLVALRQSQIAESKAKAKLALLAQNPAATPETTAPETADPAPVNPAAQPPTTVKPIAKAQPSPVVSPAPAPPARLNPAPTYSTVTPPPRPVTPLASPSANRSWTPPPAPKPVDALAEWQRLAALGTYGEVVASEASSAVGGGVDANATVAALFANGQVNAASLAVSDSVEPPDPFGAAAHAAPLSDYFEQQIQPVTQTVAQTVAHWEAVESVEMDPPVEPDEPVKAFAKPPLLAQAPDRTLLVGRSGQGHLVTPVLWAPDGSRGEARFIVALSEPIPDAQGQPALPNGTQFVVAAQNLDPDSGLVDLTVVALVIDGQEYEAPEGIFSVRDREGGLLLGELRRKPNSGRGDAVRIATGALAQVGQIMNRPRSSSTSTTNGSFGSSQSSTTENDDPNYIGAVLEGGFTELASVMAERQQAAAEALAKAPQLYQLPADYPIRIFINQSLSL